MCQRANYRGFRIGISNRKPLFITCHEILDGGTGVLPRGALRPLLVQIKSLLNLADDVFLDETGVMLGDAGCSMTE